MERGRILNWADPTMEFEPKLFAVYLGGRAPRCNTELHDVTFAVGASIEETYEQLLRNWFGNPRRLHLDSWLELQVVDGHRIVLSAQPVEQAKKLYFVNLGAYQPGQFTEFTVVLPRTSHSPNRNRGQA